MITLWMNFHSSGMYSDFEEVVRLDTEYIKKWSPGLDIMILFKTVAVVLGKVGSK